MTKKKKSPPFDSIRVSVTSSSTRIHLKTRILNATTSTTKKTQTNKQTSGQKRRSRFVTQEQRVDTLATCVNRVTPLPAAVYLDSPRVPARQKREARGKHGISGGAFQTKR